MSTEEPPRPQDDRPTRRPRFEDRVRDLSERFGAWLDELLPGPAPVPVPVPVPVRRRR